MEHGAAAALALEYSKRDIKAFRNEYIFPVVPRWILRQLLADDRDIPAAHLLSNVMLLALPCALALLLYMRDSCWGASIAHAAGAVYLVTNYALFIQRWMLTLHFTEHRKLFKPEWDALNLLIPYIISPMYGVPCGLYRPHHVIMHHVEDNRWPHDISSTEPFQRDNFAHFLFYWCRYWMGAWFELPAYAIKRKRYGNAARMLACEAAYWAVVLLLWQYNPTATLWVLVIPFFLSSFLLMFGNWSQHVFVDPDRPDSPYRSAYNCVACFDNSRTYNDGYHIGHHLNSRTHWSELPQQFAASLEEYDAQDALVFQGIGFFDVGLAVFTRRLERLLPHIVPCGPRQATRSRADWVALMRRRLQPVRCRG